MTKDEANRVAQAMRQLDQFAEDTHLGRKWHDAWRQFFAQAIRQIAAMVVEEPEKPAKPPADAEPAEPAEPPAEPEQQIKETVAEESEESPTKPA